MKLSIVPENVLNVKLSVKTLGKEPQLSFVSLIVMKEENYWNSLCRQDRSMNVNLGSFKHGIYIKPLSLEKF